MDGVKVDIYKAVRLGDLPFGAAFYSHIGHSAQRTQLTRGSSSKTGKTIAYSAPNGFESVMAASRMVWVIE